MADIQTLKKLLAEEYGITTARELDEAMKKIGGLNIGVYSDKLSHLHFHLAPKYVDGPDYGGTFQMNPGKVYLTDVEYQELVEAVRSKL